MDECLKNALWNVAYSQYWEYYANKTSQRADDVTGGKLLSALWWRHFNRRLDEFPKFFPEALQGIKRLFVASDWASVYDFVEFIAQWDGEKSPFVASCNKALEKHVSAYRFVGTTIAPLTSDEEIAAVEETLSRSGKFSPVALHIKTALARLADRKPDYRNSIKESISAVEATCQIITNNTGASLGPALKALGIHPALQRGFSAIYGYTSDAEGIRHALSQGSNGSNVGADDARFFLVSRSAFVNYLIAKSATTRQAD